MKMTCKLLNNSVPCVLLLILLGLNIGSCKVDQKQDVLRITVQKKTQPLNISQSVSSCELIPIEAKYGNLVSEIELLLVYKENIIVADVSKSKKLLILNHQGKLIGLIHNIGHGPFEYTGITDFTIDETKNAILILDRSSRKLIWYSLEGLPLMEKKFDLIVDEIAANSNRTIICYSPNSDNFAENQVLLKQGVFSYDPITNTVDQLYVIDPSYSSMSYSPGLCGYGSRIFLCLQTTDTLFRVTDNGLVPMVSLDFGEWSPPEKFFRSFENYVHKPPTEIGFITGKHFFCSSGSALSFAYSKGGILHFNLINLEPFNYSFGTNIINDLGGFPVCTPLFIDSSYIYCYTQPYLLQEAGKLPITESSVDISCLNPYIAKFKIRNDHVTP